MSRLEEFTKGELVKLVTEKWIGKVTVGITETIGNSFVEDQVLRPVQTRDEIERRFRICIKWFVTLRRDLEWSVPRILDDLPKALRHELDGTPYSPDEKRVGPLKYARWAGSGGPRLEDLEIEDEDLAPAVAEMKDAIEASDFDQG